MSDSCWDSCRGGTYIYTSTISEQITVLQCPKMAFHVHLNLSITATFVVQRVTIYPEGDHLEGFHCSTVFYTTCNPYGGALQIEIKKFAGEIFVDCTPLI